MPRYIDGFVIAVPKKNIARYQRMSTAAGKIWMDLGSLEYIECVGDDLDVEGTNFHPFTKAAKCKPGETVVFSWIVYKSRKHRDQVNKKVMANPRIARLYKEQMTKPLFDHKRMAYGGFKTIVERGR